MTAVQCMSNLNAGEVYGYDGGKHVKGRKRHIIVDTLGLLLMVVVSEANMNDRLGAILRPVGVIGT